MIDVSVATEHAVNCLNTALDFSVCTDSEVYFQISRLATEYASTCMSPDENRNDNEENGNCTAIGHSGRVEQVCDVYVWGSNSSYQLSEGAQEKISVPKLAAAFVNVVQVAEFELNIVHHMCEIEFKDRVEDLDLFNVNWSL